jgi:hypothetical protein
MFFFILNFHAILNIKAITIIHISDYPIIRLSDYYLTYFPARANESTINIMKTPINEYKIISSVT